jgi:hypothetical protein
MLRTGTDIPILRTTINGGTFLAPRQMDNPTIFMKDVPRLRVPFSYRTAVGSLASGASDGGWPNVANKKPTSRWVTQYSRRGLSSQQESSVLAALVGRLHSLEFCNTSGAADHVLIRALPLFQQKRALVDGATHSTATDVPGERSSPAWDELRFQTLNYVGITRHTASLLQCRWLN